MNTKQMNKQTIKTARSSRSEWVDALTRRWQRRVTYFLKTGNIGPKCAAMAVRGCIRELREESRSAPAKLQ